jgi:long-subunit acyl-CoA synthetase (AMP-forming)
MIHTSIVIKVVDLENGRNVGPNERGELCFKGPLIMKGYRGDTHATTAIFDSDGFLHTGDVGYYDEDGFFYVVDRVKELIKYKGYQVGSLSFIYQTNTFI